MMYRSRVHLMLTTAILAMVCQGLEAAAADPADAGGDVEVVLGDQVSRVPFQGDWEGRWTEGWPPRMVAQVVARGEGRYQINFLPEFDQRCPPLAVVETKVQDGVLRFDHDGWSGMIDDKGLHGTGINKDKPVPLELSKVTRLAPGLGAKPPTGAIVLYDGGDLDAWETDGRAGSNQITWQQRADCLRVWPTLTTHSFGGAIRTRGAWSDFQLHLEFRLPLIAAATGQTRANSGIIIEEFEFYEVQILDSYGLPGYWDDCGGIYKKESPKFNMCAPPGQWQSYDIVFHGPKLDAEGQLSANPRITVDLNGVRIHNDIQLPYSTAAVKKRREQPEAKTPGRITLQHHGDAIDFRNIWLRDLSR